MSPPVPAAPDTAPLSQSFRRAPMPGRAADRHRRLTMPAPGRFSRYEPRSRRQDEISAGTRLGRDAAQNRPLRAGRDRGIAARSGSPPARPACSRPGRSQTPHTPAGTFPAPGPRVPARPRRRAARLATPRPGRAAWPQGTRGGQHPRLFTSRYDARRLLLIAPLPGTDPPPRSGGFTAMLRIPATAARSGYRRGTSRPVQRSCTT